MSYQEKVYTEKKISWEEGMQKGILEGIQRGKQEGRQEGKQEGKKEERSEIIEQLKSMGVDESIIKQLKNKK